MRGFLPKENPLSTLPKEYYPVEELQRTLPEIFGTKHARPYLAKFPPIEVDFQKLTHPQIVAIARNCLFAGSAFVHNHGEPTANYIPQNLAHLMVSACDHLRVPPILSYQFYCLNNWQFIGPEETFDPENLHIIQGFIPDDCENWFIVIHTAIERAAGPALLALAGAQELALDGRFMDRVKEVKDQLLVVRDSLEKMIQVLRRMPEKCRPEDYYHRVRPQIKGFDGVIYEGVEKFGGKPQYFRGETGAQSSIIPAFIRYLGIRHQDSALTKHLDDMLNYMPRQHRWFLQNGPVQTNDGSSVIRDYVISKLPGTFWTQVSLWMRRYYPDGKVARLKETYNDCLKLLHEFRTIHLGYAITYIQERTGDRTGTGGTPYVPWLTQMRDETLNFLL